MALPEGLRFVSGVGAGSGAESGSSVDAAGIEQYLIHLVESTLISESKPIAQYVTLHRLVIHLTSHQVLDYGMLADFFLTYRLFASPAEVLQLLFARMAGAVLYDSTTTPTTNPSANANAANDPRDATTNTTASMRSFSNPLRRPKPKSVPRAELGRDVAVRTFIVMRYWILNFFADDFLPSIALRTLFTQALDSLAHWSLVTAEPQFCRIVDQLRRAWISQCSLYWAIDEARQLPSDPLTPGGRFGDSGFQKPTPGTADDPSATSADRRRTILSFYKASLLSPAPDLPTFTPGPGNFIRGGIPMFADVEVSNLKPPTPVKEEKRRRNASKEPPSSPTVATGSTNQYASEPPATPGRTPKLLSKKSFRSLRARPSIPKLFRKRLQEDRPIDSPASQRTIVAPTSGDGRVRIDLLSARVIEELDRLLKCRSVINKTSKDWEESIETSYDEDIASSPSLATREECVTTDDDNDRDMMISVERTRPRKKVGSMIIEPKLKRTSVIDQLDIRSSSIRTMSMSIQDMRSSVRTASIQSFESYDSDRSASNFPPMHSKGLDMPLKRQHGFGNLRKVANLVMSDSSTTTASLATGSSAFSVSTTQLHPQESKANHVASFSSMAEHVAERLRQIPDDTPEEDAIAAALEKLEGTYTKKEPAQNTDAIGDEVDDEWSRHQLANGSNRTVNTRGSVRHLPVIGSSRSLHSNMVYEAGADYTSELYNDAFENQVKGLNIAAGFDSAGGVAGDSSGVHEAEATTDFEESDAGAAAGTGASSDGAQPMDGTYVVTDGGGEIDEPQTPVAAAAPTKLLPGAELSTEVEMDNDHTPFILNYSSKVICEQLTLIERDALALVDWKDLIELQWPGTSLDPIQSWVSFLVEKADRSGVEMVISRFNLTVNWVKSEILLTWNFEERVQALSRFIHIAYQCSQHYRNYATMMQIVLALNSGVVQKLYSTWDAVSNVDQRMFRQLTELISPQRNFAALRRELNDAMAKNTEDGCVPFVGMYLSDLTFNAEQPTTNGEGQINFGKFSTAASIVKGLLHCVERSSKYDIEPDHKVLAKCLYVHSLTAEEMDMCERRIAASGA